MKVLGKLWNDDRGFVVSSELVLIATVVVIGLLTGLAAVRDAVISELSDVAVLSKTSIKATRSTALSVITRTQPASITWTARTSATRTMIRRAWRTTALHSTA